jgi:GT2 family glycosyltransferase
MKTPVVSVLIPCYQHGHWLGGALASVFAQTVPGIEAIVVNDGSTDGTAGVARDWQLREPGRVLVLDTPRIGQAAARAAALERASGGFYVTLDADDLLEPGMAADCLAVLERQPAALVAAADVWMVDESGSRALRLLKQGRMPAWPKVLDANPLGGVAGLMVRRESALRIGGGLTGGQSGAEDWDFAVRLVRAGAVVAPVGRALARYRQSASSHSRNPVPALLAKIEMFERCLRPDPRLACPADRQPLLDEAGYRRVRNRAVFFALGLAAAGRPAAIPEILGLLAPGSLDRTECAAAFAQGAAHGNPAGVVSRETAAIVRGTKVESLEQALEWAVARSRARGPRYWLRRLEAWRATRRFKKERVQGSGFREEGTT